MAPAPVAPILSSCASRGSRAAPASKLDAIPFVCHAAVAQLIPRDVPGVVLAIPSLTYAVVYTVLHVVWNRDAAKLSQSGSCGLDLN